MTNTMDPVEFEQRFSEELAQHHAPPAIGLLHERGRRRARRRLAVLSIGPLAAVALLGTGIWSLMGTGSAGGVASTDSAGLSDSALVARCVAGLGDPDLADNEAMRLFSEQKPQVIARASTHGTTAATLRSAGGLAWADCLITNVLGSDPQIVAFKADPTAREPISVGWWDPCTAPMRDTCDYYLARVQAAVHEDVGFVEIETSEGLIERAVVHEGFVAMLVAIPSPAKQGESPIERLTLLDRAGQPLAEGYGAELKSGQNLPGLEGFPAPRGVFIDPAPRATRTYEFRVKDKHP